MKIKTIMEDSILGENMYAEHGLCIYVETSKHKLLVDTGQSDRTWDNAKMQGIRLELIDTVILSHGHYDHSGGLMGFAGRNPSAQIYMRENAGKDYYAWKEDGGKYIGIDKNILSLPNIHRVSDDIEIDSELSLFTGVNGRRLWPKGNTKLRKKENDTYVQDDFSHEQYLVIKNKQDKFVLISGCAHNGILNILDKFRSVYQCSPSVVISGFHMVQKQYSDEDLENIKSTAEELKQMDTLFYTGHCTGETAFALMKEIMGEKLQEIRELDVEI